MSPFGGSVASDEPELALDEGVPESSVVPDLKFVPNSNVVIQEGEECLRRVLEDIEASDSRTEEASEGESFIDIMGGLEKKVGSESEGLTLADILRRADPLSETVLEGMECIYHCDSHHSSYSFSFVLRSNLVAIYILHRLVYSARRFMKMASWGFVF